MPISKANRSGFHQRPAGSACRPSGPPTRVEISATKLSVREGGSARHQPEEPGVLFPPWTGSLGGRVWLRSRRLHVLRLLRLLRPLLGRLRFAGPGARRTRRFAGLGRLVVRLVGWARSSSSSVRSGSLGRRGLRCGVPVDVRRRIERAHPLALGGRLPCSRPRSSRDRCRRRRCCRRGARTCPGWSCRRHPATYNTAVEICLVKPTNQAELTMSLPLASVTPLVPVLPATGRLEGLDGAAGAVLDHVGQREGDVAGDVGTDHPVLLRAGLVDELAAGVADLLDHVVGDVRRPRWRRSRTRWPGRAG